MGWNRPCSLSFCSTCSMKKLIIAFGVLILVPLSASAVGVAGQRRDGTIDPAYVQRSVTSVTTIRQCGTGRMRSVRNYQVKCEVINKGRLRSTQSRTSNILNKPVYRGTVSPTVRRTQETTEKSIEAQKAKYWRDRLEWKDLAEGAKVNQEKAAEQKRVDELEQIWWIENFNKMFK